MKYDVFISHASEDKVSMVKSLVDRFESKNIKVWYDQNRILPGDSIIQSISEGLRESRICLVILSKAFLKKDWTKLELGMTNLLKDSNSQRLVPVYYGITHNEVAKRLPFLADIKAIDARIGIAKVVKALEALLAKEEGNGATTYKNLNELDLLQISELFEAAEDVRMKFISKDIRTFIDLSKLDVDMAVVKARILADRIIRCHSGTGTDAKRNTTDSPGTRSLNKNIAEHAGSIRRLCDAALSNATDGSVITSSNMEICKLSLTAILNWYYNTYSREFLVERRVLVAIPIGELTEDDIIESYRIEQKVLRPDLISPVAVVKKWYRHNNYTMHGIRDRASSKLVGFVNGLPLTKNFYNELISGKVTDTHISTEYIRKLDIPDFYQLYLSSICISPDYQNTIAFKILYDSYIDIILELAMQKEIYVSDIAADASTPQGERLCDAVGMKFITETDHKSKIYAGTLIPPSLRLKNRKGNELITFCQKKYEEYKDFFPG